MSKKELLDPYRLQKWLKTTLPLVLFLSTSCNHYNAENDQSRNDSVNAAVPIAERLTGNFGTQQAIKFDAENITAFFTKYPQLIHVKNEVDSFCHNRQYAFVWFDGKGMIEQAEHLYAHILNISSEGVERASPYNTEFAAIMESDHSSGLNVDMETMRTAQFNLYSKNVWADLSEKQTNRITGISHEINYQPLCCLIH